MSNKKPQNVGRIYYIEPNNVHNEISNGIPHPYEDYCMSVDLTIVIGERNSCGPAGGDSKNRQTLNYSSENGSVEFVGTRSFLEGTNGYLTTNFTDIHSTTPGNNTNECLGIDSINISYNSWYVPQVTIRFVDVRGASLFSQQEDGYVKTLIEDYATGHNTNTKINGGSFFKALFSFPYPLFKLKVKGFYGNEVTYNLAVEDFKGSFNADNGNFEVDVRFIGYMFGVYTDIPMNYLIVSPFFPGIGENYWENNKQTTFKYDGSGMPLLTYPELLERVDALNPEEDVIDGDGTNYSEQKRTIEGQIGALNTLKEQMNSFLNSAFITYDICEDVSASTNEKYTLLGLCKGDGIDLNSKALSDSYSTFKRSIENYNSKYSKLNNDVNYFGIKGATYKVGNSKEIDNIKKYKVKGIDMPLTVVEWVNKKVADLGTSSSVVTVCYNLNNVIPTWIGEIDDRIEKLEKQLDSTKEEILKHRNTCISKQLGFGVSVGNAFKMAFAHMETFMHIFNHYLGEIKNVQNTNGRTLEKLNISVNDTDLPSNFKPTSPIPPFTLFYKNVENGGEGNSNTNEKNGKKKVVMWPGDMKGVDLSMFPEINFVNYLIEAGKTYDKKLSEYNKLKEITASNEQEATDKKQTYIPVTLYDFANPNTVNPYFYVSSLYGGNKQCEAIMTTFLLRLLYWCSTQGIELTTKNIETFSKIEAYNIYRAYPTILPSLKVYLNDRTNNGKPDIHSIINELYAYFVNKSKENNRKYYDLGQGVFKNHMLVRDNDILVYDWMEKSDGTEYLPITNFTPNALNSSNIPKNCIVIGSKNKDKVKTIDNAVVSDQDKRTTNYDNAYLNTIDNSSDVSVSDYEKIVYDTKAPNSMVNVNGNNEKQRRTTEAVCIASSKNVFSRNNYGVELPGKFEKNSDSFYVDSPAHIKICVGKDQYEYYQLYGHPIFYEQNTIPDLAQRNRAKAFLFATGVPMRGGQIYTGDGDKTNTLPYYMALWEGAHLWFANEGHEIVKAPSEYIAAGNKELYTTAKYGDNKYTFKNLIEEDGTCVFLLKNANVPSRDCYTNIVDFESGNNKEQLINLFTDWADNVFPGLNNLFELSIVGKDDQGDTKSGDGFKKLVKTIEGISKKGRFKLKDRFGAAAGSYNKSFYDEDAETYIKNGKAFDYVPIRVSDTQEMLLEYFNRYVILIDQADVKDNISISLNNFTGATSAFINQLYKIYDAQLNNDNISSTSYGEEIYDPNKDVDYKISTYLTLKNLYDRWICMVSSTDRWKLGVEEASEFSHFKFIDGFYRNISDSFAVNFQHVTELASQMMASSNVNNDATNTKYQGRSFYDFLASICQKNQMLLLSLPMENEFTNPQGICDIFDAKSYSKMDTRDTSCFVCLYSNKPSQHLEIKYDNDEYLYASDGFNISNAYGEVLEMTDLLPQLTDTEVDGYDIPAFGVTYGKQNQSIFKKVTVNMQNPQVTEASIAATQLIASKTPEGPNKTALFGQDLYRIYANYSYTCTVEMMGDAQMMPLMYFQLNNIPLFRGTYMIINVEHSLSAGEMTTKFTGVRLSRNEIPLKSDIGYFTDPFTETNIHSPGVRTQPGTLNPPITDDEYQRLGRNATNDHKYTVNFSDLTYTSTGVVNKIVDTVLATQNEIKNNLRNLQSWLQYIQDAWVDYCAMFSSEDWAKYDGLLVTSGYRCKDLNKRVGGANSSLHQYGFAADIQVCKYNTSQKNEKSTVSGLHNGTNVVSNEITEKYFFGFLHELLKKNNIPWDELINEGKKKDKTRWTHFGYARNGEPRYRYKVIDNMRV